MQFKNVIGQSVVKQKLVDMVAHNRLSHALLFLGKEGSGALPLALAFAEYICLLPVNNFTSSQENSLFQEEWKLPLSPSDVDIWTQQQSSFSKAEKLIHPDVHFSYPVITKKPGNPPISTDFMPEWREFIEKFPYGNIYDWLQFIGAENKQGNITAQECNDIIRKLNLKSYESGYKILVMWMPEYLGKEGNKLLKLIEEPPADTLFILVAETENNILSTITSRCQLVKVPALDIGSVERALMERNKKNPEEAIKIASISGGNYREALLLSQHDEEDFHVLLKDWLNACLKSQVVLQVKSIEEISRLGRENQKQFLRYFTHLLEQAIKCEIMEPAIIDARIELPSHLTRPEQELIPKLNKAMTLEQKEAIGEELDKAAYYIERNANAKILFHALTIKIYHIVKYNVVISI